MLGFWRKKQRQNTASALSTARRRRAKSIKFSSCRDSQQINGLAYLGPLWRWQCALLRAAEWQRLPWWSPWRHMWAEARDVNRYVTSWPTDWPASDRCRPTSRSLSTQANKTQISPSSVCRTTSRCSYRADVYDVKDTSFVHASFCFPAFLWT